MWGHSFSVKVFLQRLRYPAFRVLQRRTLGLGGSRGVGGGAGALALYSTGHAHAVTLRRLPRQGPAFIEQLSIPMDSPPTPRTNGNCLMASATSSKHPHGGDVPAHNRSGMRQHHTALLAPPPRRSRSGAPQQGSPWDVPPLRDITSVAWMTGPTEPQDRLNPCDRRRVPADGTRRARGPSLMKTKLTPQGQP